MVWWAKKENHPLWSIIIALILNTIGIIIWIYTMRKGIESATAITIYALFTMSGCTMIGYFIFGEALSLINWIGIILAAISLILISI